MAESTDPKNSAAKDNIFICDECGTEFELTADEVEAGVSTEYCSPECAEEAEENVIDDNEDEEELEVDDEDEEEDFEDDVDSWEEEEEEEEEEEVDDVDDEDIEPDTAEKK